MDKKIITFFLASSITDLESDRNAVGDFVTQLNNIYESSGVLIKFIKCESETLDHSIRGEGSQAALDEYIKESDMCFVIFWHKVGDVTFHELQTALEANKKFNKPKIVVYFKKLADGESPSDEIKEVMRIIDEELLHYHREYEHIDSLKLGIITQLQVHGFVKADITVKNNKVMCGNNQIMSVDRIPLFADNAEYTELLAQYSQVLERCETLQAEYAADNGNYKVYRELGKAVRERDRLKADIDELTENILDIGNSIASMTSNGSEISDNIRRAIKCFDAGDYDGVLEALDPKDIEKNVAELDEIENNIIGERIAIVEEYRMRILALKAQARWSEVYDNYTKAVAQVENRPQMPKTVMYEYASFLFQQTHYNKCIEVCKALSAFYDGDDPAVQKKKGQVENLCGLAYYKVGKYKDAEARLSSSLKIRKQLAAESDKSKLDYAESCANLAKVYYYLDRHGEAGALYSEALSVYRAAGDSDGVRIMTVDVNMSLADLYYQINRHRDAEALLSDAYEVCLKLSDTQPSYEEYAAAIGSRLAHTNRAILMHRYTDRYFVDSLKMRSALLKGGKQAFESYLERVCTALAKEYEAFGYGEYAEKIKERPKTIESSTRFENVARESDFQYYDKEIDRVRVENWCTQALKIRRKLAQKNPEAYESGVAESCRNLAEFYLQIGASDKAKRYLGESLEIQMRLLSFTSERVNAALAATYCSFAALYSQTDEFALAEDMYIKALDIYRALSFTNELARTYYHLGRLYLKFVQTKDAVKSFFDSMILYIELYRKSPDAYIDRLINTFASALYSLGPRKEKEIMPGFLVSD